MLIPLFGTALQSKSSTVTAQDRINVYAELPKDPEKGQLVFYGFPGLSLFWDIDDYTTNDVDIPEGYPYAGPIRSLDAVQYKYTVFSPEQDYLLAFKGAILFAAYANGDKSWNWGIVAPGGPLTSATNRLCTCPIYAPSGGTYMFATDGANDGTQFFAVNDAAVIGTGSTSAVVDADAQAWTTCAFVAQRVVATVANDSRFFYSEDATGSTWDALSFQDSETSPDSAIRVYNHFGALVVFGFKSTEFFQASGDADVPFAPVRGATLDWGIAAPFAVASVSGSTVFLGRNAQGSNQVVRLQGYTATVISDRDMDYEISQLSDVSDCTALSYNVAGNTFVQFNFTNANKSYALNITSGVWSRLTDENGDRHRAEIACNFNGRTLVSDYEDGKIYELLPTVYTNNGEILPREITTRHFFKDFDRVIVDELVVDFEVGIGNEAGDDPQVMLQISKDNGKSWGNELWKSLGKIGETKTRVVWRRLGQGRDWTFRLRVTDPVRFVIAGASINAVPVVG